MSPLEKTFDVVIAVIGSSVCAAFISFGITYVVLKYFLFTPLVLIFYPLGFIGGLAGVFLIVLCLMMLMYRKAARRGR